MSERGEGWYWVKYDEGSPWECVYWEGTFWDVPISDYTPEFIGVRIPAPDEPWQCVPVEMTPKMGESVKGYNRFIDWREALAAAPSPDDTP